jgi:hypothetical protein
MLSPCLSLLLAGLFFSSVRGDLPVHCEKRRQLGVWHMKRCNGTSNAAVSCGHTAPDRVTTMPDAGIGWSKPGFDVAPGRDLYFSLKNPNVVRARAGTRRARRARLRRHSCAAPPPLTAPLFISQIRMATTIEGLESSAEGTWTMVYDEGFHLSFDGVTVRYDRCAAPRCSPCAAPPSTPHRALPALPPFPRQYVNFFKYTPKFEGADFHKVEDYNSVCDETVSGWYLPESSRACGWGAGRARAAAGGSSARPLATAATAAPSPLPLLHVAQKARRPRAGAASSRARCRAKYRWTTPSSTATRRRARASCRAKWCSPPTS